MYRRLSVVVTDSFSRECHPVVVRDRDHLLWDVV